MKTTTMTVAALAAITTPVFAATEAEEAKVAEKPRVEVCFVLDTTGSMSGLIQGAKDKIWSIANEMVSTKPTPEIKFGLIGYRDRSDAYVTKVYELTEDIDAIYGHLMEFQAQGGGDTPESVNQALHEAVTRMDWDESEDVLKIIFLVGDAPPHMDYPNDVKYPEVCQAAMKKDLIINTIQCGTMSSTTPIWREIADRAEGEYAAILQSGGTIAISTPYDADINEINRALGATVIGYGDMKAQRAVAGKLAAASAAPAEAAADRADFFSKTKAAPSASAKVISGSEDLTSLIEEGKLSLDELEAEKLPEPLKKLSREEQRAAVEKSLAERKELNARMEALVKQRSAFLEEEKKRLAAEGKGDGFDLKVKKMIKTQAESKGIRYGE